ncbi:hypothetical protein [uncultured Lacinutrix sp.]|uniref:hypothetical protein n=1 Tax=uncultured Lacinutrix sp. TaxID=574032 RepID=UPI00260A9A10|nr:hypothetical protein [uncultured Lacinutrix sp.]
MATIVAPSVLLLADDTLDVSLILDLSEEEEEKGQDKNKRLEFFVTEDLCDSEFFIASEKEDNLQYAYKKYTKPHLNLISPPPEFI